MLVMGGGNCVDDDEDADDDEYEYDKVLLFNAVNFVENICTYVFMIYF